MSVGDISDCRRRNGLPGAASGSTIQTRLPTPPLVSRRLPSRTLLFLVLVNSIGEREKVFPTQIQSCRLGIGK